MGIIEYAGFKTLQVIRFLNKVLSGLCTVKGFNNLELDYMHVYM